MFQFPGFAHSHECNGSSNHWVAPFRNARINSCLQIPEPFRSLPRLSSPPDSLGILRSLFFPFAFLCLRLPTPTQNRFFVNHESYDSILLLPIEIVVRKFRINQNLQTNSFYLLLYLLFLFLSVLSMNVPGLRRRDTV